MPTHPVPQWYHRCRRMPEVGNSIPVNGKSECQIWMTGRTLLYRGARHFIPHSYTYGAWQCPRPDYIETVYDNLHFRVDWSFKSTFVHCLYSSCRANRRSKGSVEFFLTTCKIEWLDEIISYCSILQKNGWPASPSVDTKQLGISRLMVYKIQTHPITTLIH